MRRHARRVPPAVADPPSEAPPAAAFVVAAVLSLVALLPWLPVALRAWRVRRMFRACPCCGARAVRRISAEQDLPDMAVECGQCSTWRRSAVSEDERRRQLRRLERERRRLGRRLRHSDCGALPVLVPSDREQRSS